MFLHIPPPNGTTEIANAALYLVTGFVLGILAAYGLFLKRNK